MAERGGRIAEKFRPLILFGKPAGARPALRAHSYYERFSGQQIMLHNIASAAQCDWLKASSVLQILTPTTAIKMFIKAHVKSSILGVNGP